MALTFTPASDSIEFTEYVGTAGTTVTITYPTDVWNPAAVPPVDEFTTYSEIYVYGVTMSLSGIENPTDLNLTFTDNSFTFSSAFGDTFERSISYLQQGADETKKSYGTVNRFANLPSDYKGLYRYVPPASDFKDAVFTISAYEFVYDSRDEGGAVAPTEAPWGTNSPVGNPLYDQYKTTYTWTCILRYNWQSSRVALQQGIANGSGAIKARAKYPELA